MKRLLILAILLTLSACSQSPKGVAGNPTRPGIDPEQPFSVDKLLGRSSSLLAPGPRLLSYQASLGLVAIVDPQAKSVITQERVGTDFDFALPIDRFNGYALFAERTDSLGPHRAVQLRTAGQSLDLMTTYNEVDAFAVASDVVSFASLENGGALLRLFEILENGERLAREIDLVWQAGTNPTLAMSENGRSLLGFAPDDGGYLLFKNDEGVGLTGPLVGPCTGGDVERAKFRAILLGGDVFYAGDGAGGLYRLSTSECEAVDVDLQLASASPILKLSLIDGALYVAQHRLLTVVDPQSMSIVAEWISDCAHPTSMAKAGTAGHLVLTCLEDLSYDPDVEPSPEFVSYGGAAFVVYDAAGAFIRRQTVDLDALVGSGLAQSEAKLYLMNASAFGQLTTVDLLTGESQTESRLLLRNILE